MIEDRKAVRDSIKRALAVGDKEEVARLTKHLEWLDEYLRENENVEKTGSASVD